MAELSKEQLEWLVNINSTEGAEVHKEMFDTAFEFLRDNEYIELSNFRGPNKAWTRAELTDKGSSLLKKLGFETGQVS